MLSRLCSRRAIDATLAALAVVVSACAGGGRSAAPGPMPLLDAFGSRSTSPAARASAVGPAAAVSAPARPAASKPANGKSAAVKSASTPATRTAKATAGKPAAKPASAKPVVARPASAARPKAARVDSAALEFAVTARLAHEPLTRAIARRTRNPAMAERAAWAVTREAGRVRVSPSLLAAVLLIENRQLDSTAVSSQGAIGLMQVMPVHAGSYGCGSADLTHVDANICHGARILHLYLVRSRSVTVALRRYNGCVRGANTPRCSRYPVKVLQTAARLRRDILASATEADRRVQM
jgi:soluble lytic murein transglycosylase-like protein